MKFYTATKKDFFISEDKQLLNVELIHAYLSNESYWAKNISIDVVESSIQNSMCFGIYKLKKVTKEIKQVGFARVITDCATFGYIADVFVSSEYRGRGLSKWLMEVILAHPQLQNFRRWMLATLDAHGLYAQFGFKPIDNPERYMRLTVVESY